MNKQLEKRANDYAAKTEYPYSIYFSTVVPDGRYKNYKYFFKYSSTNSVASAFKTQKELECYLDEKEN